MQRRLRGSRRMDRKEYAFKRSLRALWGAIVLLGVITAILLWHNWMVLILLVLLLPVSDVVTESWPKYERDWAAANAEQFPPKP